MKYGQMILTIGENRLRDLTESAQGPALQTANAADVRKGLSRELQHSRIRVCVVVKFSTLPIK